MPGKNDKGLWKQSKRAAWRKVAGEAIILDVETAAYYSLDGVGLRMWELLGSGTPSDKVVKILSDEYDASPSVIRKDYAQLVAKLRKEKLIEPA